MLEKRILEKGMEIEPLSSYIDSFRHGVSPHAGAGIGLDRVVFLYLGKLLNSFCESTSDNRKVSEKN